MRSSKRLSVVGVWGGGRRVRAAAGLAGALGVSLLGGCKNNQGAENVALTDENTQLRDENAQLKQTLSGLQSRLQELENAPRQPAGAGGAGRTDGFPSNVDVTMQGSDVVVGIQGEVLFDSGKATLKSSAKRTLDQVADVIKSRFGGNTVRVEGYTDTDPIRKSSWKTNERLSGERAMAVEQYLVSRGIPADRIYFAGFGPANAKATKQQSRRVQIVILGN